MKTVTRAEWLEHYRPHGYLKVHFADLRGQDSDRDVVRIAGPFAAAFISRDPFFLFHIVPNILTKLGFRDAGQYTLRFWRVRAERRAHDLEFARTCDAAQQLVARWSGPNALYLPLD